MASKTEKIIIVGLDNAGKSTIVLTLKQKMRLGNLIELEPTKGVATETIETSDGITHVWDFGGQERYRRGYLEKKQLFEKTDKMIFVIDIQDEARYDQSLQYLEEILKILQELNETDSISIFLHKFDPDLLDSPEFQNRSKMLRRKLRSLLKPYNCSYDVFHTSIYTVFQRIKVS
ncbi:MAG: ADP-ribosylation factor-like protein [Candidatus Helarchaeota archaeon]